MKWDICIWHCHRCWLHKATELFDLYYTVLSLIHKWNITLTTFFEDVLLRTNIESYKYACFYSNWLIMMQYIGVRRVMGSEEYVPSLNKPKNFSKRFWYPITCCCRNTWRFTFIAHACRIRCRKQGFVTWKSNDIFQSYWAISASLVAHVGYIYV